MTSRHPVLGHPRIHLARTTSTMDEIASRAPYAAEGLTVVADEQTMGRGRANREWHAAPGSALLFSTLLRPECDSQQFQVFSLLAGLAVAESIEACCGARAQVKWPNDVLIDGKKVAGILVTTVVSNGYVQSAVLGVGINVLESPPNLEKPAISLAAVADSKPDADQLLDQTLAALSGIYQQVLAGHTAESLDRWLDRAAFLGEAVAIADGDTNHRGRFRGITQAGALVLETEAGRLREIRAGEFVRGPVSLSGNSA